MGATMKISIYLDIKPRQEKSSGVPEESRASIFKVEK
jgi:hypothetical protein